jgi:hypothetical protein
LDPKRRNGGSGEDRLENPEKNSKREIPRKKEEKENCAKKSGTALYGLVGTHFKIGAFYFGGLIVIPDFRLLCCLQ